MARERQKNPTIGFIGAGNMARSLARGLIENGWAASRLTLSDPEPAQRRALEASLGVRCEADNKDVAATAEVLVLAVKPQVLKAVALELAETVQRVKPLIVSIAAGVRLAELEQWLGPGIAIVRVMPNTPALIGAGAAGMVANRETNQARRDQAEAVLRAVGVVVWVEDEAMMDVITALSGSGPAYFFLVMEALEAAAIREGLDPANARLLTLETAYGAAKMALEGQEEPAALRRRVTSPGGTTERAVSALQKGNIEKLLQEAVTAAVHRSRELAEMMKNS